MSSNKNTEWKRARLRMALEEGRKASDAEAKDAVFEFDFSSIDSSNVFEKIAEFEQNLARKREEEELLALKKTVDVNTTWFAIIKAASKYAETVSVGDGDSISTPSEAGTYLANLAFEKCLRGFRRVTGEDSDEFRKWVLDGLTGDYVSKNSLASAIRFLRQAHIVWEETIDEESDETSED